MKICTKCKVLKSESEFYSHKHTKDKLASLCKQCYKDNEQNWRLNNPDAYKISCRRRNLKKKFNISLEDYEEMYKQQNGKCACCFKEKENVGVKGLVVDHNHTTGEVRQLLCHQCNTALGLLKEDINIINNLLKYIRKHNG